MTHDLDRELTERIGDEVFQAPTWPGYDPPPGSVPPPWREQEPEGSAHTWRPLDLVELGSTAPQPPDVGALFYTGRRHLVSGEDDAGKTMLNLGIASDEVAGGHGVIWIDTDDMGPNMVLERLHGFGASDEQIRARFFYLRPEEAITDPARNDVVELITNSNVRLVVNDAFNASLALHGYNPKATEEVEAFFHWVVAPFCHAGAAVVLLDHVVKDKEARGRYAYGAERKSTGSDVHLGLRVIDPFGRGRRGRAKITVHRDRVGFLEKPSPGLFVLDSDPDTGRLSWQLSADTSTGDTDAGFRPTTLMERVSRYLEIRGEPRSLNQIEQDVQGNAKYLRLAIDVLVAEGYASESEGARKARMVTLVQVFREDVDEAAQ